MYGRPLRPWKAFPFYPAIRRKTSITGMPNGFLLNQQRSDNRKHVIMGRPNVFSALASPSNQIEGQGKADQLGERATIYFAKDVAAVCRYGMVRDEKDVADLGRRAAVGEQC